MKRKIICAIGLTVMFYFAETNLAQAQIFKKILDNVKKNQQSDSKSGNSNQSESIDTSESNDDLTRVFGAFGKAASDNPNDTSSSDLVMKALGNLTGGGGVSAADSAAAIQTFRTAKGGSGVYYETTNTVTTKKNGTNKTISKTYITASGEGRSEMNLAAMMGAKNSDAFVVISRAIDPRYSIVLDKAQKQYSLNVIDTSLINSSRSEYKVTKIGNEMVHGYHCTHATIVTTSGKGMFASSSTMDIWTSPAVPGYASLKKWMTTQNITVKMLQALEQAGCDGYIVKLESHDKDYSMTMELTTAKKTTFPASLFKIPAGYTQSENNLMFSNLSQAGRKQ